MRRVTKEEFWDMRINIIKKHGGSCEVRDGYAVCHAPWWPFHWVIELIEATPGDYGLRLIPCLGSDDDDSRCRE